MNIKKNMWWQFALCILLLIIDRITKWWSLAFVIDTYRVNDFLSFQTIFNKGISWGMLNNEGVIPFILLTVTILALISLFSFHTIIRSRQGKPIMGELLVLVGALSNLFDRLFYPGVIDFILVSFNGWAWPIFNCADVCIVIGVGIIFLQSIKTT